MSEMRISSLCGKITIVVVICCLVMVGFVENTALAVDGSGTEGDPWQLQSLEDFNDFAADANYWAGFTRLETDVNLAGIVYERAVIAGEVNDANMFFEGTAFTGVFDGNGQKIINLIIYGKDYLGLFGFIDHGEVRNLGVEGVSVSGQENVGGLAGMTWISSVSNCYSTGDVSGAYFVGGLVGSSGRGSVVSNCYSTSSVPGGVCVGGLLGENYGSVSKCYSTGTTGDVIDLFRAAYVGGLIGYNFGSVSNCYSTGDVGGHSWVGGLVGVNDAGYGLVGSVSNCYSTGDVAGSGEFGEVGGLVGDNYEDASISYSCWDIDTQTHGVTESIGLNEGTAYYVLRSDTRSMQRKERSPYGGWDFVGETVDGTEDIWTIHDGVDYPKLVWELVQFVGWDGVDFRDYSFFANRWQDSNCGIANDCDGADLDFSDTVDGADMKIFFDHWLEGRGN